MQGHHLRTIFGRSLSNGEVGQGTYRGTVAAAAAAGRKEPYWATLERGLAVGYHRPLKGGAGTWWARALIESAKGLTRYRSAALGSADDHSDADGEAVLNWRQAQDAARAWAAKQTQGGPLTVEVACREYVEDLRVRKGEKAAREAEGRIAKRRDEDAAGAGKDRRREIHLPDAAVTLLRQLAAGKRAGDYLFTNAEGLRWTPSLHQRPFAEAVATAGLDPDTTFYALRHSYISRALLAGVPMKAVAVHCGTSAVMIERHYAKFIRSDQQRFAVVAAPDLRLEVDGEKVVSIQAAPHQQRSSAR